MKTLNNVFKFLIHSTLIILFFPLTSWGIVYEITLSYKDLKNIADCQQIGITPEIAQTISFKADLGPIMDVKPVQGAVPLFVGSFGMELDSDLKFSNEGIAREYAYITNDAYVEIKETKEKEYYLKMLTLTSDKISQNYSSSVLLQAAQDNTTSCIIHLHQY